MVADASGLVFAPEGGNAVYVTDQQDVMGNVCRSVVLCKQGANAVALKGGGAEDFYMETLSFFPLNELPEGRLQVGCGDDDIGAC